METILTADITWPQAFVTVGLAFCMAYLIRGK